MDKRLALPLLLAALAGCDQLGLNDAAKLAEKKEADAKAIGGACRHAGRAIETCYEMNPKASKSAVYAGWRDMDAYMRENKMEALPPEGEAPEPAAPEPKPEATEETKPGEKPEAEDKKGAAAPQEQTPPPGRFRKVS